MLENIGVVIFFIIWDLELVIKNYFCWTKMSHTSLILISPNQSYCPLRHACDFCSSESREQGAEILTDLIGAAATAAVNFFVVVFP